MDSQSTHLDQTPFVPSFAVLCCIHVCSRFSSLVLQGGFLCKNFTAQHGAQTQTCVFPNLNHNTCIRRRAMRVGMQESTRCRATVVGLRNAKRGNDRTQVHHVVPCAHHSSSHTTHHTENAYNNARVLLPMCLWAGPQASHHLTGDRPGGGCTGCVGVNIAWTPRWFRERGWFLVLCPHPSLQGAKMFQGCRVQGLHLGAPPSLDSWFHIWHLKVVYNSTCSETLLSPLGWVWVVIW